MGATATGGPRRRRPGRSQAIATRTGAVERALILSGVAVAYVAAGKLGLHFAVVHASASAVWPATGLAIASLLVLGYRVWPAIFAGAFLVNVTTASSVLPSLGIAAGNTLEGLAGAWLVNRFAGGAAAFDQPRHVFAFAGLAGLGATTLSATLGVASLRLGNEVGPGEQGPVWLTWWLGDAAGALLVTPLILLWSRDPDLRRFRGRALETAALALVVLLGGLVVFGGVVRIDGAAAPVDFACIPALLWAAFRFGPRATVTATALLSAVAVAGTLQGHGPFVVADPNVSLLLLQAFMATIAVTALAVAVSVWQGERAALALRASEEIHRLAERRAVFLAEASAILASSLDPATTLRTVSRLVVPAFADWCIVDLVGAGGALERVAVSAADPGKERLLGELQTYVPDWASPQPSVQVLLSGQSLLIREVGEETLQATARDPRHLAVMRELGPRSAVVVPLRTRARTVGAITLVAAESDRRYGDVDVAFAEELGRRAAVAVDNAALYAEAQRARTEAEAVNQAKDEFLATLSHELRTPLNAILGWVTMLRGGALDEATAARGLEVIERSTHVQSQLVVDLLDVSRIITGKMTVDRHAVDLERVVATAIDGMRPAAEAKTIEIVADLQPVAPTLGDPERLQQVVSNLVSNAVKFTGRGGKVAVWLRGGEGAAEIGVRDTGEGISPEFLPHVFDRFRQADSSSTRAHGGLGLGLAIVRHLVELHGGTVLAESAGRGQGATFTVRLPLVPPVPVPPRGEAPAAGRALAGLQILVVDDDGDTCDLLETILGVQGAAVQTVRSVSQARAALQTLRPDVVLCDIAMPGENGFGLMRELRAGSSAHQMVPAVALTALAGAEDRQAILAAGFDAHAAKPVDPHGLVSLVARIAARPSGPGPASRS